MPPPPCLSICRPAARAISHDWVTFASITSRKSSGFWSMIFATLFSPEATTRMSTRPNFATAAATIASQSSSLRGRRATISVLPPSASHSAATFFNSSARLAASTVLAPAPASTFAASEPNAPVAPVITAVLPRTSNSASGFLRNSSDMGCSFFSLPVFGEGRVGSFFRAGIVAKQAPPCPPRRRGGKVRYFGGAEIATSMVTTSFVRLITSRTSFGPMKQLSFGLSTVSLPPAMTVSSPARMK